MFRGVDDKAGSDRLPRLRRSSTAHRDRTAVAPADLDDANDVLARPDDDDADGGNAIDAGVRRIEGAGHGVEAHLPVELGFELTAQGFDVEDGRGHAGRSL